jgi:streptogramin lyase
LTGSAYFPFAGWLPAAQVGLALATVAAAVLAFSPRVAEQGSHFHETAVFPLEGVEAGSPFKIVTGAPGEAWFTLPAESALGRLVVTSASEYSYQVYELPETDGLPYDLVYTPEAIWLTERDGYRVTRFDPTGEVFTAYPLPHDSAPSGIALAPDGKIWFAGANDDRLYRLDPADPGSSLTVFQHTEHPDNGFEGIVVAPNGYPWVTAPLRDRIIRFEWDTVKFVETVVNEGPQTEPFPPGSIAANEQSWPWITGPSIGQVGLYTLGTLSLWRWYSLPYTGAVPGDLVYRPGVEGSTLWVLDGQRPRLTWLLFVGSARKGALMFDIPVVGSQPQSIAVDDFGMAWIAVPGAGVIVTWVPPQLDRQVYLPTIFR